MSDNSTVESSEASSSVESVQEYPNSAMSADPVIEEETTQEVPETPVEEAPKPEKLAPKLAKLKEREAQLLAKEQEVERRLAEAEARASEAQKKEESLELLKKNPTKALNALGLTFNDLAEALLNEEESGDSTPSEIDAVKSELEQIKKNLADREEQARLAQEQAEAAQLDSAVQGIKQTINQHLQAHAEDFDLILATGKQDAVYDMMKWSWDKTGEVMHFTEACKIVEDYLTEQMKPLAASRKLQTLIAPTPKAPQKTSFGKTLSNQIGQVVAVPDGRKASQLTREAHEIRKQNAIKHLRFT